MSAVLRETKTCVDCERTLDAGLFPLKDYLADGGIRRGNRCVECHRAHRTERARARRKAVLLKTAADFLPMGPADRGVALRWSVGVAA